MNALAYCIHTHCDMKSNNFVKQHEVMDFVDDRKLRDTYLCAFTA
jgi:methyltransferase-like protein